MFAIVSYMAFVLSSFFLISSFDASEAVLRNCGISRTISLIVLVAVISNRAMVSNVLLSLFSA